jgi:NTP pyrophosphatase (non-canonical NTP hydrolase)
MNLKNSQLEVDNWIKEHGVRYFNELTNMAQLTEEVGEVARIIARRYGEQSEKESDKNKDLGEELADVVFVVLCLANQSGIDLQHCYQQVDTYHSEWCGYSAHRHCLLWQFLRYIC